MSLFPGAIASFLGFTAGHVLKDDSHAVQHNSEQAEIVAAQTKIGTGASTPTSGLVLRGNGVGTSAWGQVQASTDLTGVLPVANGGTGIAAIGAGVANFLATPNSANLATAVTDETGSGGLVFATAPTLSVPLISDFTSATHTHANNAGGGQINGGTGLQSASITASRIGTDSSFAFTDYSASSTIVGWSAFTTKVIKYCQIGKLVFVEFVLEGTSNSASSSFTLPVTQQGSPTNIESALGLAVDNGSAGTTTGRISFVSNVVSLFLTNAGTGWTASGTKQIRGQFFFEAA